MQKVKRIEAIMRESLVDQCRTFHFLINNEVAQLLGYPSFICAIYDFKAITNH